jgi:hypothetical protein
METIQNRVAVNLAYRQAGSPFTKGVRRISLANNKSNQ